MVPSSAAAAPAASESVFKREDVLARSANELEHALVLFEKEGFGPFEAEYLQHWLHSYVLKVRCVAWQPSRHSNSCMHMLTRRGQVVTLQAQAGTGNQEQQVRIQGLTRDGFLQAIDDQGRTYALHPDGNSLDFFKGLIATKVLPAAAAPASAPAASS